MAKQSKAKRRGFVMTGGGAKGLYEAGVVNGFHISGMECDVISGSSIGAMNSIFFAEYLLRKRSLPSETLADPEKAIQEMENLIRCYHRTWLLMPSERVIDDSEDGSLGKLMKDLEGLKLNVSDVVTLAWWSTDPARGKIPPPGVWPALSRILGQFLKRLGQGSSQEGIRHLLRIWKDHRNEMVHEILRTYLQGFGLEFSMIPAAQNGQRGEDGKIESMFTRMVAPLQDHHLSGSITDPAEGSVTEDRLLDPARTLKDFLERGIDVRLTRANYRTGRLEVSAYLSREDFLRYMEKQAWRLEVSDPEKMPLGSFRLLLPGNPIAVKSALASGRFPGVFAPFPFREIYSEESPDNKLLYNLLEKSDWMSGPEVQRELKEAYTAAHGARADEEGWLKLLARWQKSASIREFFPYPTDTYVDGGTIDNTPSNTVVDATRERLEVEGKSRRDTILELYVIFLDTEPRISEDEAKDPLLYDVVQRTLAIQSAAVKASDAVVVDTINNFGERADKLARSLLALLAGLENVRSEVPPKQFEELETAVRTLVAEQGVAGYRGRSDKGILMRMKDWAEDMLSNKLPLHVEEIKIYPDRMSLSTLQFTERLGYHKQNAIEMITMGCYNTLWAMRNHLESQRPEERDARDEISLKLTRKWMGIEDWPGQKGEEADASDARAKLDALRNAWRCTRTECLFHARYCAHGANLGTTKA